MNEHGPTAILKTSRAAWVPFGLPFPTVALASAIAAIILDRGLWFPTIVLGLVSAVLLSWLNTTRLVLTEQAVHYRALFVRKDISLSSIIGAKFEFGPKGMGPMQRVVFKVRDASKPKNYSKCWPI
jgi:hypothetical protein